MKSYDDLRMDLVTLFDLLDSIGVDNALQQEVMLPLDNLFSKMYVPQQDSVECLRDNMNKKIDSLFDSQ